MTCSNTTFGVENGWFNCTINLVTLDTDFDFEISWNDGLTRTFRYKSITF